VTITFTGQKAQLQCTFWAQNEPQRSTAATLVVLRQKKTTSFCLPLSNTNIVEQPAASLFLRTLLQSHAFRCLYYSHQPSWVVHTFCKQYYQSAGPAVFPVATCPCCPLLTNITFTLALNAVSECCALFQ
jgi:hypothetical protein